MLSAEGFECSTATNGLEALEKAFYERPHLILIDPDVGGLNGPNLCQALKADGLTALIPVVFMSSRYSMEILQAGLESGAVDYLQTPLESKVLLSRITRYTSEQYVAGQAVFLVTEQSAAPIPTTVVKQSKNRVFLARPADLAQGAGLLKPGAALEIHHAAMDFNVYRRRAVLTTPGEDASDNLEVHLATGVYRAQKKLAFKHDVHFPARYRTPGGFFRLGTIVEICGSGFRMTGIHDSVEVGSDVQLEFKIPQRGVSIASTITWRHEEGGQITAGVQAVDETDPAWRLDLTRFLYQDLIQPMHEVMSASS